ncbi:MAG: hypothetical protein J3Q66DRAFT_324626 [Benniella sp.]|nr:MAG: hypothetical protein J3Q66DRAFT_324626 [Benniella sp.]
MTAARAKGLLDTGRYLASTWTLASGRKLCLKVCPKEELHFSRKHFTIFAPTRRKFSKEGGYQEGKSGYTREGSHPRHRHNHSAKPGSPSNASSSTADVPQLTFDQRLDYLQASDTSPHPTPSTLNPSSPKTTPETLENKIASGGRDRKKLKTWKRYRTGFQPGDFMCPQCGSHNFRPPERELAARIESKVLIKQKQITQKSVMASWFSSRSSPASEAEAAITMPTTKAERTPLSASSSSPSSPSSSPSSMVTSKKLTRHQKTLILQQKVPLGANAHCFECGFETLYSPPLPSTPAARSTSTSPQDSTNVVFRNDLRLTKPRDYICPQCQTVNFNNRLHCVGCGVLVPWIRESVLKGPKGGRRGSGSVKNSRFWVKGPSK